MWEIFTTYNIIIGVSVILNIVLLVGVRNLLRQNEQLEDRLVDIVNTTREKVVTALSNMRRLDNREVFEKDDEVGVTFSEMKKIVEDLDNEL
jgi:low affinity Fe/Cu permease